jgi:hypothetical protein
MTLTLLAKTPLCSATKKKDSKNLSNRYLNETFSEKAFDTIKCQLKQDAKKKNHFLWLLPENTSFHHQSTQCLP